MDVRIRLYRSLGFRCVRQRGVGDDLAYVEMLRPAGDVCKTARVPPDLRELTRQFGRGETTLEALRLAARAENRDRGLADQLLQLIREWEISPLRSSERAKNDLREQAENLVPPPPPPLAPAANSRRDPSESIYAAGLRGQRRRD